MHYMARTKPKTKASSNGATGAMPSHDELWDDSALLDSWDAALQEYKKYHSLHARGLTVTESLEKYDAALDADVEHAAAVNAAFESADNDMAEAGEQEDGEHNEISTSGQRNAETYPDGTTANQGLPDDPGAGLGLGSGNTGMNNFPAVLLSGHTGPATPDAGLKNLLMSWYYAGYYTGLHEGQQMAHGQDLSTTQNGPS